MILTAITLGETTFTPENFSSREFQEAFKLSCSALIEGSNGEPNIAKKAYEILTNINSSRKITSQEHLTLACLEVKTQVRIIGEGERSIPTTEELSRLSSTDMVGLIIDSTSTEDLERRLRTLFEWIMSKDDEDEKDDKNTETIHFFLDEHGYYMLDIDGNHIGLITDMSGNEYMTDEEFEASISHYCFLEDSGNIDISIIESDNTENTHIMTLHHCGINHLLKNQYGEHICGIKKDGIIELYNLSTGEIIFSLGEKYIDEIIEVKSFGGKDVIVYSGLNDNNEFSYMVTNNDTLGDYILFSKIKPNLILGEKCFLVITYNQDTGYYFILDSSGNHIPDIKSIIDEKGNYYFGGNIPKLPLMSGNNIYVKFVREKLDKEGKVTYFEDEYATADDSDYNFRKPNKPNIFSQAPTQTKH